MSTNTKKQSVYHKGKLTDQLYKQLKSLIGKLLLVPSSSCDAPVSVEHHQGKLMDPGKTVNGGLQGGNCISI